MLTLCSEAIWRAREVESTDRLQIQVTGPALSPGGRGRAVRLGCCSQLLQGVSKRLLTACCSAPHKLRTGFFLCFKGLIKDKKYATETMRPVNPKIAVSSSADP